jgi:hypothetical protein
MTPERFACSPGDIIEISPGAEESATPAEQHAAHLGVLAGLFESRLQCNDHLLAEGI